MPSYTEAALEARNRVKRHNADAAALLAKTVEAPQPDYDATTGAWINPELVMGSGVVTPPGMRRYKRPYASLRAGRGSWADVTVMDNHKPAETLRSLATYGWATSPFSDADTDSLREAAEQGSRGCTVLVSDADGNVTIVPVSHYRAIRAERRKASERVESAAERRAKADYEAAARIGSQADYD